MLEELGEPYEHVAAPPRSEGVTAFNPAGKVPVLVEDGTPITDSTAIIQYLADKHGKLTHRAGTLDRARQDSLTQFLLDEFDANLWMAARHSFVGVARDISERKRVEAELLSAKSEAEANKKFAALGEGGQVQMPLGKTFFSPAFGMVADKFGVSWMVVVM